MAMKNEQLVPFSKSFSYYDGHALGEHIVRPIDLFSKFICQDVIKLIVDQTNIYGKQRYSQKGEDATKWKEVDENQIHAFLDILFIMGFHKLPKIRDYWSQDRNLFTPAVANTMARNDSSRIFIFQIIPKCFRKALPLPIICTK